MKNNNKEMALFSISVNNNTRTNGSNQSICCTIITEVTDYAFYRDVLFQTDNNNCKDFQLS